jgi:hypothetical protein
VPESDDRSGSAADDPTVREETEAAAAEAAAIGGEAGEPEADPADHPVAEAGGGEAEGFEQAERALEESATHGDGGGIPTEDAGAPEEQAGSEYGEADEVVPAEGRPDEGADAG